MSADGIESIIHQGVVSVDAETASIANASLFARSWLKCLLCRWPSGSRVEGDGNLALVLMLESLSYNGNLITLGVKAPRINFKRNWTLGKTGLTSDGQHLMVWDHESTSISIVSSILIKEGTWLSLYSTQSSNLFAKNVPACRRFPPRLQAERFLSYSSMPF